MKRLAITAVLFTLFVPPLSAREWTSASGGKSIEADYYGKQGDAVYLRKPDGKIVQVKLELLSEADRQYVAAQPASAALARPAEQPAAPAPAEAKDRFSQAIEQNPNDPGAYYTRGMARVNQGRHAEALADFNKAIQLKPDFAAAYDGRGTALSKSGKPFEAHADFDKAIELDPELASAYRNRGDNVQALWTTPQGKEMLKDRAEMYRERYEKARASNLTKTPWQPLNTTSGNTTVPALNQMRQVDYIRAREIEDAYGGGVGGGGYGVSIGGGGVSIARGGVNIVDGGLTVVNPGTTIVGNPPLAVYPEEVVKGQTITLVANPAELSKAMPPKTDARGRPLTVNGQVQREPVYAVDFYRDVDGDGVFNPDVDEYLASDNNGKDGFSVEVSTAAFPPGNQAYFAVGRGQQPSGVPSTYGQAAEAIRKAAATEREIAEASQAAAGSSGYTAEEAQKLRSEQRRIGETTQKMASAFAQTTPEAAQLLAAAVKPMQAVDTRLDAGEKRPGVPSIAQGAADKAAEAADLLDRAYAVLSEKVQGEEDGKGSPSPAAAAGAPAVASGMVKPGPGAPAEATAGPGRPGPGGPGYGGRGGDDDGDVVVRDRGDRTVVVDRDRVIDRALRYIDDDDYDAAVLEYDRYLVDRPDDHVLLHRADAYVRRGSYDYAVRDYDRLVGLDRQQLVTMNVETADLYYNRGCAHLAAGQIEAAIADFDKSISLDETRNLAFTNRGSAKARKGLYAEALLDFDRALQLEPRDELALRNRALAYRKLDQIEKAEADLKRLRELSQPAVGE